MSLKNKDEEMKPVLMYLQFDTASIFYLANVYFCRSRVQNLSNRQWVISVQRSSLLRSWTVPQHICGMPKSGIFQLKRSRKNFRVTYAWLSCAAVCLLLLKLLHFVHPAAISCSPAWHLVFADIWSLLWCRSSICVGTTKRLASYVQDDVSNSVWPSQGAKCVAEKGTLKRKSTNNKISFWLDRWASNYPHLCILIFILQGGF